MQIDEDALKLFIDSRIKPELQEHYTTIVSAYRAAWTACERNFRSRQGIASGENRTARVVESHPTQYP